MPNSSLEKVRADALKLAEPDRAELARELVASLDGTTDADAGKAWEAEILRRISEIDAGTARLIDREEFSKRLRDRMHRR
jgi:putative addiction module component (TIGR02574 family)